MKKTNTLIISGFLGSGKTTFIKKYIKEAESLEKTVIIENEFGEVGIDGEILKKEGINVKEINSGCICCSVSGSFKDSIKNIKKSFDPDTIIIEPSGVAKLSEIEDICRKYPEEFKILQKITIVDPFLYKMYTLNFGEFYIDQVKNSNIILFSRYSKFIEDENSLKEIIDDIMSKNKKTHIVENEWTSFNSFNLIYKENLNNSEEINQVDIAEHSCCGHSHDGHSHDEHLHKHSCCGHSHDEHLHNDDFESIAIHSKKIFTENEIRKTLNNFNNNDFGSIVRCKGTVKSESGYYRINFVPKEINIESDSKAENTIIIVIGRNLNKNKISKLFC